MARTFAILTGGAGALAAAGTALFLFLQERFRPELLVVLGLTVSPYAFFVLLAWVARRSAAAGAVIFLGQAVSAAFAAWAFHDAFFPSPDMYAGLLFGVVPAYQGIAGIVTAILAWIAGRLARRVGGRAVPDP